MTTPVSYKPSEEGKTHINVFHKSRTELGRILNSAAKTPFKTESDGFFNSLEGYRFWLLTGKKHNNLRMLYSASAVSVGAKLPLVPITDEEYQQKLIEGLHAKVEQTPHLKRNLQRLRIPIVHYETFGRGDDVVRYNDPLPWLTKGMNAMTAYGKNDAKEKKFCQKLANPGEGKRILLAQYWLKDRWYSKFMVVDQSTRNRTTHLPEGCIPGSSSNF